MKEDGKRALDWKIEIQEVSAGVYRVTAVSPQGIVVERTGTNPEELEGIVRGEAFEIISRELR